MVLPAQSPWATWARIRKRTVLGSSAVSGTRECLSRGFKASSAAATARVIELIPRTSPEVQQEQEIGSGRFASEIDSPTPPMEGQRTMRYLRRRLL
jgi:hypothetical protein